MAISSSFYMIMWMRNKAMVVGYRVWKGWMAISVSRGIVMGYMVAICMMMTVSMTGPSMMVPVLVLVAVVGCVVVSVAV